MYKNVNVYVSINAERCYTLQTGGKKLLEKEKTKAQKEMKKAKAQKEMEKAKAKKIKKKEKAKKLKEKEKAKKLKEKEKAKKIKEKSSRKKRKSSLIIIRKLYISSSRVLLDRRGSNIFVNTNVCLFFQSLYR